MQRPKVLLFCCTLVLLVCAAMNAQQAATSSTTPVVPRLVNFSGRAINDQGKPVAGVCGITFSIYKDQYEGAPLWMETQNVTADSHGNYSVHLGSTMPDGIPLDLFSNGEARWLGVRINGGEEQARVLLLSVPYALKAADAQTLGGLPASAFMLAATSNGTAPAYITEPANEQNISPATSSDVTTSDGTVNSVPLWTTATNIQSSVITQTGSGTTAKVGIGTTTPASTLDVTGGSTIRGTLLLPATGTATASAGKDSQPLKLTASAFVSTAGTAATQNFQWQAEPAANNTAAPSGSLNLLFAEGSNMLAETGLKVAANGQITFATGQVFPGTGKGTVTSVASGTGLKGGPITASGTLSLDTTKVPLLASANTFTANQTISGSLTAKTVVGDTSAAGVNAVSGFNSATSADGTNGVYGQTSSPLGSGTVGLNISSGGYGVYGEADGTATGSAGVWGNARNSSGSNPTYGVYGTSSGTNDSSAGVYGSGVYGVQGVETTYGEGGAGGIFTGYTASTGSGQFGTYGVVGLAGNSDPDSNQFGGGSGVDGQGGEGTPTYGDGTGGDFFGGNKYFGGHGIYAAKGSGDAGYFYGDVEVAGTLSKSSGAFKIDHPLDPANKYLYHSFVESPDMMNVYNGNVLLDGNGEAVIQMPEWFSALNRDFRYQLTCIGGFAPLYIAEEMNANHFTIAGGKPGLKVSWQVTGIRQDAWANAHRIPVEQEKKARERGFYLHPELYGAPPEKQLEWARHQHSVKMMQEIRTKQQAIRASALPESTQRK